MGDSRLAADAFQHGANAAGRNVTHHIVGVTGHDELDRVVHVPGAMVQLLIVGCGVARRF